MDYIDVKEAVKYTGRSAASINRLIKKLKDTNEVNYLHSARNEQGQKTTLISPSYLKKYYELQYEYVDNIDNVDEADESKQSNFEYKYSDNAENANNNFSDNDDNINNVDVKQQQSNAIILKNNETIYALQQTIKEMQYGKPFYKTTSLWITLILLLFIAGILEVGYLYRNELISNNEKKLSNIKINYENRKDFFISQIADLKQQYTQTLFLIKESNTTALKTEQQRAGEYKIEAENYKKEITELNKKLSELKVPQEEKKNSLGQGSSLF
jgi:hypothetical protein